MLKKNVDLVVVGNNYISYLLAYQLILTNKEILILDDERISMDENHFKNFSLIESSFISAWGEDLESPELTSFEQFITPVPMTLNIGKKQVLIGRDDPYSNLKELARKLPEYFFNVYEMILDGGITKESFNKSYHDLCQRIGKNLCRFKTLQNYNLATFLNHCPDYFSDIFELFYSNVKFDENEFDDDKALFIYSCRAIYHDVLSVRLAKIEAIHLLISLIGPRLSLSTENMLENLKDLLEKRGGNFRRSQIREWKFNKSRPWCVELNSFEGIVHPKGLVFIGGKPREIPLQLGFNHLHNCYHIKVKRERLINCDSRNYHFNEKYMGAQFPFWIEEDFEDHSIIRVFSKGHNCEKAEFLKDEMIELLKNEGIIKERDEVIGVSLSTEVLSGGVAKSLNLPEKMTLRDGAFAYKGEALKDVHYIGPCKRGPLGLLSSLMESKDFRTFI